MSSCGIHLVLEHRIDRGLFINLDARESGLAWRIAVDNSSELVEILLLPGEIDCSFTVDLHTVEVPVAGFFTGVPSELKLLVVINEDGLEVRLALHLLEFREKLVHPREVSSNVQLGV